MIICNIVLYNDIKYFIYYIFSIYVTKFYIYIQNVIYYI